MNALDFLDCLLEAFSFSPTNQQEEALDTISEFLFEQNKHKVLVLQGYAGTGKTTLIKTLIQNLWRVKYKAVLLAPTGKAAKVVSNYTNRDAYTIHRCIYNPKPQEKGGVVFELKKNKASRTLFIVDESSMISDQAIQKDGLFENGNLLADLISYVYNHNDCYLFFIGDTAQLPPVKSLESPALSMECLETSYQLDPILIYLDQVVRQSKQSSVLTNATSIRACIENLYISSVKLNLISDKETYRCKTAQEVLFFLNQTYKDIDNTYQNIVLVHSNKRANIYNEHIRTKIIGRKKPLEVGDQLMVVRNNYYCLSSLVSSGFIANGDALEVTQIIAIEHKYDLDFARVRVSFVDRPDISDFETLVFLDTLYIETSSLPYEKTSLLYQKLRKKYLASFSRNECNDKIKQDPYYNALQVKFAYAITCHKSQGGQWDTVFIEQPSNMLTQGSQEYLRWLYTAVTRAKKQLYWVGFDTALFS